MRTKNNFFTITASTGKVPRKVTESLLPQWNFCLVLALLFKPNENTSKRHRI